VTRHRASRVARELAVSLGIRMYVVRRSEDDYLVLQNASLNIVEIQHPEVLVDVDESHGRFTIAAASRP
jgi:hypothetical protein